MEMRPNKHAAVADMFDYRADGARSEGAKLFLLAHSLSTASTVSALTTRLFALRWCQFKIQTQGLRLREQ